MSEKRKGIVISYVTLFFNTFFSVFYTPFLISSLGTSEFGLYQLIHSFTGYLVILNFGTGIAIARFIAKYRAEEDIEGQENFLVTASLVTLLLFISTLAIGAMLFTSLDLLFIDSLNFREINLAKQLYIVMIANISLQLISNAISGIMIGYEKFTATNLNKLFRIILKYAILFLLLKSGYKSISIVLVDLVLTMIFIVVELWYVFSRLKVKVKYHYIDKKALLTIASFSVAMLIQAVLNQVNQNLDRVILGAVFDTHVVAVYSISLVFFTTFSTTTRVIGGVFMPQATRMITNGASGKELTDLVIRPGRIQFIIGGAIVSGFILFGQSFIELWVGKEFLGAYLPAVILLISSLIPLVQNVATAIVDAMMKRLGLSIISMIMVLLNIALTLFLVKRIGYIGAAYGTAISVLIGNILLTNIYYQKEIKLDVLRMLREILHGIFPVLLLTTLICLPIAIIIQNTWIGFFMKGLIYFLVYMILLYKLALNNWEKEILMKTFRYIMDKGKKSK